MEAERIKTHALSFLLAGSFILVFGLCLCVRAWPGGSNEPTIELQERINPNTAPVCSLMRLPQIGRTRALTIVGYRRGMTQKAFGSCDDLQNVKGIGPVICRDICSYLRFD